MSDEQAKLIKRIKPWKIIVPMILGVGVVVWLFYGEFDAKVFSTVNISGKVIVFIGLAFLMMAIRDLGYMIRIKILSENKFSWRSVFNINFLWEFTSAITPSAVGGTAFAVIYVFKEGLSLGKSTALVLATAFLDELYFFLMFPLMILLVNPEVLFGLGNGFAGSLDFENRYFYFSVIGYGIKTAFILLVFYGLFLRPFRLKQLLLWLFRLPFLKRWRKGAEKTGDDIVVSSEILKKKGFAFWLKSFLATFFSWSARYLVLNFLLLALYAAINPAMLNGMTLGDHLLVFARQLVMWIMMLVLPSPGGSGFAEAVFSDYMADFMPLAFVGLMAFLWRIVTYYPYLIIGAVMVPKWVAKHFSLKKK